MNFWFNIFFIEFNLLYPNIYSKAQVLLYIAKISYKAQSTFRELNSYYFILQDSIQWLAGGWVRIFDAPLNPNRGCKFECRL